MRRERASEGNERCCSTTRSTKNVLQFTPNLGSSSAADDSVVSDGTATMSTIPTKSCRKGEGLEGAPSAKICAITLTSHEITAIPFNPLSSLSLCVYLAHAHIRRQTALLTLAHMPTDRLQSVSRSLRPWAQLQPAFVIASVQCSLPAVSPCTGLS